MAAFTRAALIQIMQDAGATLVGDNVVIPRDNVVGMASAIRAYGTQVDPTVPDADADTYVRVALQLQELRDNSPHPVVRALARFVIQLGG